MLFTLQSSQHGPDAHSASAVNLQVMGSQQGSESWHSSIVPQSHSSPSSTTPLPQVRKSSSCANQNRQEREKKMRLVYRKRPKRLLRHITRCCCCWGDLESNKKVKGNGATSFLASPQHKDRYCQELAIYLLASADCNRSTRQNLLGFFSVYITLLVYTFSLSLSLSRVIKGDKAIPSLLPLMIRAVIHLSFFLPSSPISFLFLVKRVLLVQDQVIW